MSVKHFAANCCRYDRPPISSSRPNVAPRPTVKSVSRPSANGASSFVSVRKGVNDAEFVSDDDSVNGEEEKMTVTPELSKQKEISSDPFNLYNLINKRDKGEENTGLDSSLPFPPSFTPADQPTKDQGSPKDNLNQRVGGLYWRIIGRHGSRLVKLGFYEQSGHLEELRSNLRDIDKELDQGGTNEVILQRRLLLKSSQWGVTSIIPGLISDVQTAFLLPNRQILDGPFIINELLSWCKHKKQQAMVFKVDFAKAYDSIRWDFLEDVLTAFGFV
ncbi:hypothetical protein Tco_1131337 [Tanacetum coccineum]